MSDSFYSIQELRDLGLKDFGEEVFISRKASIYSAGSISVGNRVRIDDFCVLAGGSGIDIGNYVHIGCYSALFGGAGISMEDFSGLSARVTLYSESDDYSGESLTNPMVPLAYKPTYHRGPIRIGRHGIVGANSTVLPGVAIGEGAAVGAHCLIMKDCEPWGVYFGAPARRVGKRSEKVRELEQQFLEEHGASDCNG